MGRRYDAALMSFCVRQKILGGNVLYRTLKTNADDALPSPSAVIHKLQKMRNPITEGMLRHEELRTYLKSLKLPLIVSLSEDATNVTGLVEYSPKFNQIVGFVPPLNKDVGMPVVLPYAATSAAAMESIMLDPNVSVSNMVNIVMAQPLSLDAPAFCLLIFGGNGRFTKEDVVRRWSYITKELANVGIEVLVFSSDSDPRYNAAMRNVFLEHKTDESSDYPSWFQYDLSAAEYIPIQDTVHIGTKLRNRILNQNLMIGDFIVSTEHLVTLIENISADKHGLHKTHIDKRDKMNFSSVQKITDTKVTTLLKQHVPESAGTVMFLKITNLFLRAFLDGSLTPCERVRNVWYTTFILRIWRESVVANLKPNEKLATHFITTFTYACIEINAHALVATILRLKRCNMEHLFFPHLLSSQPCESFFRKFRALSTTGSSMTNASVLGTIQRCERIALVNEIEHNGSKKFNFDTDSKRFREIYYRTKLESNKFTLPSRETIIEEIEKAKQSAIKDAAELGLKSKNHFKLEVNMPKVQDSGKSKKKNKSCTAVNTGPWTDGTKLETFKALHLADFSGQIDLKNFNEKSSYVRIDDTCLNNLGERCIYVRKSALVALYMQHSSKLSSDRLRRVTTRAPSKTIFEKSEVDLSECLVWLHLSQ